MGCRIHKQTAERCGCTLGPSVTPTTLLSLSTPACSFFRASMFLLKCSCFAIACVCTAPPLLQDQITFVSISDDSFSKSFSSVLLTPPVTGQQCFKLRDLNQKPSRVQSGLHVNSIQYRSSPKFQGPHRSAELRWHWHACTTESPSAPETSIEPCGVRVYTCPCATGGLTTIADTI